MSRRRRTTRVNIPVAILPDPRSIRAPMEPIYAHRRPGKPTLMTEDVLQRFLLAIRAGNYRNVSARYAGLNPDTVYHWYMRGQNKLGEKYPPTAEYVRFVRLVDEAEAAAVVLVVGNLVRRSAVNTKAAEFWLTNRYREQWQRLPEEEEPPPPGVVIDQSTHQNLIILDPREHPELVEAYLNSLNTTKVPDGARIRGLLSEG